MCIRVILTVRSSTANWLLRRTNLVPPSPACTLKALQSWLANPRARLMDSRLVDLLPARSFTVRPQHKMYVVLKAKVFAESFLQTFTSDRAPNAFGKAKDAAVATACTAARRSEATSSLPDDAWCALDNATPL
eukprot:CAMPEP_0171081706 /NCGR_PEP_ID=MMETSP0766_2-20121228/16670_1 /TAXON_ID=439317 /ORGANISM="Gambierdiscus australes, Strain CAWD 149" /LENGTH=132 /DNA_ID=CAMNT_0011539031 /DNA_START=209 /DNA_END=608 /DNA_ORIENTATION=+